MTVTKEWLHGEIARLEAIRDEIPFGLDEDGANTLEALKMLLAGMDSKPVAYFYAGSEVECKSVGLAEDLDDEQKANCIPLFAAPPAPVALSVSKNEIRQIFMNNGFTIKEGQTDLKDYVYAAAFELISSLKLPAQVAVPDDHCRRPNEQRLLTLLCDFEGAGKDARDIGDDAYAQECEDTASIIREVLQHRQAGTTRKLVADQTDSKQRLLQLIERGIDFQNGDGEPATADEKRQLRDLVMMVKMLCRTVKKYNATSQQAKDYMEYLQREGLISATDCLRVVAKDGE